MNLAENWMQYMTNIKGYRKVDALNVLNEKCNTQIKLNRYYEWRDGIHSPNPRVTAYMLKVTLTHILKSFNIDTENISDYKLKQLVSTLSF